MQSIFWRIINSIITIIPGPALTGTEADLWRGGYERPGVDEFLAGRETGLIVWFTPRGTLDASRTRRLLQVMASFVRIGDWGTLTKVQKCSLLRINKSNFMKQFSDVNIEFSLRLNSTTEELYISRSQHSSDAFAIHICLAG